MVLAASSCTTRTYTAPASLHNSGSTGSALNKGHFSVFCMYSSGLCAFHFSYLATPPNIRQDLCTGLFQLNSKPSGKGGINSSNSSVALSKSSETCCCNIAPRSASTCIPLYSISVVASSPSIRCLNIVRNSLGKLSSIRRTCPWYINQVLGTSPTISLPSPTK